jgi:tetratricopeptide (TPR) repeat protein
MAVIETPSVETAGEPAAGTQPEPEIVVGPESLSLVAEAAAEADVLEAIDRIDPQLFAVNADEPAGDELENEVVEVRMTEQESMPALEETGTETLNPERNDFDSKEAADWNALGNQFLRSGAFDNAIAAYTKAIELQPDFNWPYISNLAMAHYQKGISNGGNETETEADAWQAEAETIAPPVLQENPIPAPAPEPVQAEASEELLQPAAEPYDQQELELWLTQMETRLAAATARSEVLPEAAPAAAESEEPAVCPCLAEAESALNLNAAALEIPEDAPQIVPQDAAPLVEIPASLLPDDSDALNVTAADQVLVETVVVDDDGGSKPGNSIDWNELGNAYTRNGAYDDAIHAYKQSIRLNPRYGSPYSNLGFVYFHKGEYQIAVSLYKKSLQLLESAEDKATCWNRLGDTYRRMREYDNAMKAYEKAGTADPVTTPLLARARVALMSNAAD